MKKFLNVLKWIWKIIKFIFSVGTIVEDKYKNKN